MWYAIEGHDAEGTLPKRLAVRQQHLARLHELREQGRLLLAGPCPAIDAEDPGEAGYSGSIVIAEFDSLAAARAWDDLITHLSHPLIRRGFTLQPLDTEGVGPWRRMQCSSSPA